MEGAELELAPVRPRRGRGRAAEKAKALGGRVVLAPRADIRNGSLAIVVDPTGAALALQKFPFEKAAK